MGILNKIDFKEIDLTKEIINYKKMEKLISQTPGIDRGFLKN